MPDHRPTLANVAQEAGVSAMTVSRVITGNAPVKALTKQKVFNAILKLGYRPDPALSALVAYRSADQPPQRAIGMAFIDCDSTSFSKDILVDVADAEAVHLGYGFEYHVLPPDEQGQKKLSKMLHHRGVRGLLFGPTNDALRLSGWDWEFFSFVSMGPLRHDPPMHSVAVSMFQAAYSGAKMAARLGRQRVAMMIEKRIQQRAGWRWLGGYSGWAVHNDRPVLCCSLEEGIPAWSEWLNREKPDAVLTIHSDLVKLLQHRGIEAYILSSAPKRFAGDYIFESDYSHVALEAVRISHQNILRGEMGIKEYVKSVSVNGYWRAFN